METIGNVRSDRNTARPKKVVKIVDCGTVTLDRKYDLPEDMLDSTEDM